MLSRLVLFSAFNLALPAVDFSGSWAMIVAKSNFAGSHPPQSLAMTVRQTKTQLAVESTLVDALTTLLVSPRKIVYNKAAGADTRERTLYGCGERTQHFEPRVVFVVGLDQSPRRNVG